jgi:hypothetical protein
MHTLQHRSDPRGRSAAAPTLLAVTFLAAAAAPSLAQAPTEDTAPTPAHTHLRHVAETFRGTPDRMGLLPTAVAEAEIAVRHAALMASDSTDLAAMHRHAGHVIHALDPGEIENGPGLGYGMIAAARRAAHYVDLAIAADGGGEALETHGPHVATAARAAAAAAEEAVGVAKEIMEAESADEAVPLLDRLTALMDRMTDGVDANGDGRIGWQEEESGLAQARQHLELLLRGEGIGG